MAHKPMKIVVAADSFKGSLSSAEVAAAVCSGVESAVPGAEVVTFAVADGGEGTASTLTEALGGTAVVAEVAGPLGSPVDAGYGIVEIGGVTTALIDMASASGLTLLAPDERDPLRASTYGTGQLIADAYARGCRSFFVGIGGSATCDGGAGMLAALGFRFLDSDGRELPPGGAALSRLAKIDPAHARRDILACPFTVICDVTNPLCGPDGSAAVFGPQKGASPADVALLDAALARYAAVVSDTIGRDVARVPGAGAAGGLGTAFLAFFRCELKPGVDAVLDLVGFDKALPAADLVITGEGHIDRQTLFGKLPLGVLNRAAAAGVPVVAIAGMVDDPVPLLKAGFAGIFPIASRAMSLADAMDRANASANVAAIAAPIANFYNSITRKPR